MVDLVLNMERMESVIADDVIGVESISMFDRVADSIRYVLKGMILGVRSVFGKFQTSEVELLAIRKSNAIRSMLKDPMLRLSSVIVPVPQGMKTPYKHTVSTLFDILSGIDVTSLENDIRSVISASDTFDERKLPKAKYSKKAYDGVIKTELPALFSKTSLPKLAASSVFKGRHEIGETFDLLTKSLPDLYKEVQAIDKAIQSLSTIYERSSTSSALPASFREAILNLAYRTTVLAEVCMKLQHIEHAFVGAIEAFLTDVVKRQA